MKSKMLAIVGAALVLVTANACADPGNDGQPLEKMPGRSAAMSQGAVMTEGEMTSAATMTKPETMPRDEAMMAGPDAMTGQPSAPEESAMPEGMSTESREGMVAGESMMAEGSERRYIAYSSEALEAARKRGRTVLFFKADWCPTCRSADAEFKANSEKIPGDVTILAVNYDRESALKQRYGITYQHTFVQVDESGRQSAAGMAVTSMSCWRIFSRRR